VFEGIAGPPDYLAMSVPFTGDRHRELMLRHRHVAQCGLMIQDAATGRVSGIFGRPLVRYDLAPQDLETIKRALQRLRQLLLAAGARRVVLPVALPREISDLRRSDLSLMGFHPLGTARAHADPRHGAIDPRLQVHGARGVHVADGSAVPGPLGVNPQITIMALATRLAHDLLGSRVQPEVTACRS
jgi:choline dehydrogenase-like flavoprotein